MATPTPFRVTIDPVGIRQVEVAGVDLTSQVAAVEMGAAPGEPSTLILHLHEPGTIEGEGIVEVAGRAPSAGDAVRALPLEVVEAAAKGAARLSGSYTATLLQVVAELLDEMAE